MGSGIASLPRASVSAQKCTGRSDFTVPRLGGLGCHDAREIKLGDLHFRINERFLYEYDLGDLWQHQMRIEKLARPRRGPPRRDVLQLQR